MQVRERDRVMRDIDFYTHRWQKDVKPVGLFSGKYVMAEDSQVTNEKAAL